MHPTEKAHQLLGDAAASDIKSGPLATVTTPSGTVSGNVSIGYSLTSTAEWAFLQHHRKVQHGWRRELARGNVWTGRKQYKRVVCHAQRQRLHLCLE